MSDKYITIRGKRWKVRRVKARQMKHSKERPQGECDAPNETAKEIRVLHVLSGRVLLEVLIHEMLHAAFWDMDETAIEEAGRDIAKALWSLGYRESKE